MATDRWEQEVTCRFAVAVVDNHPPRFTFCPRDFTVHISMSRQVVYWKPPEVIDNVDIRQVIEPSISSGGFFRRGTWPMSYMATDLAGNYAWCNFTLRVRQSGKSIVQVTKNNP